MQKREAYSGDVPSPCVEICKLDDAGEHCTGCGRMLDEIAEWRTASNDRKRQILALVASRKA